MTPITLVSLTRGTQATIAAVDRLTLVCHEAAKKSGWWTNLKTGEDTTPVAHDVPYKELQFSVPEKLMLIVTEVAEGMEGFRKNLQDDKLPQYKMLDVELADALIRIHDLAGALKIPLGEIVAAKMAFNAERADHKIENRLQENGKAC